MDLAPASDLGRVGLVVGGKFRLDSIIGRGAMGTVWTATHVNLGHRVAIKLVAREFVKSTEALRRFDAEAKAAARLQSRHVVQVFDNGTLDDGTPYIAMELLEGENLDERIQRTGPIALEETVTILAQCCKALARAHAAGIVHRDIKPENVFLAREPDDEADVVKLLDFGVAKITMAIEGWTASTGTGTMLGTPLYMSPEQVRASRDVDRRTDLYSLGLVAFTMLTGELVIHGDTFGEVLLKICTQPLPSLRALAPSLPPAMDAWFYRACARDPGERHPSAQDFIDSLRAAAGGARSEGRTPPPPTPPTLHSAGAPSLALPFAQTASSVSVTAAGVPRVRPGVVLAAVLAGATVTLGGAAWLVATLHGTEVPAAAGASPGDTPSAAPAAPSTPVVVSAPTTALAPPALPATVQASARSVGSTPPVAVAGVVVAGEDVDGSATSSSTSKTTTGAAVGGPSWAPPAAPTPLRTVATPARAAPTNPASPGSTVNPAPKPKFNLGY